MCRKVKKRIIQPAACLHPGSHPLMVSQNYQRGIVIKVLFFKPCNKIVDIGNRRFPDFGIVPIKRIISAM